MIIRDCTAYILAGGKSRRLGVNKLHIRIGDRSLLERIIAVCKTCFDAVKLVAGSCGELSFPDREVVPDSPLARGPMAGVIAALEDCRADYCFVTAADLPDLNTEIIGSLSAYRRDHQYAGVLEPSGLQPLCGFYHKSSLPVLMQAAERQEYSLNKTMRFLKHTGITPCSEKWRNINHPQDLALGDIHV
jgi:molybdopterin-guanine dinucleotide biosynthesis protein A